MSFFTTKLRCENPGTVNWDGSDVSSNVGTEWNHTKNADVGVYCKLDEVLEFKEEGEIGLAFLYHREFVLAVDCLTESEISVACVPLKFYLWYVGGCRGIVGTTPSFAVEGLIETKTTGRRFIS